MGLLVWLYIWAELLAGPLFALLQAELWAHLHSFQGVMARLPGWVELEDVSNSELKPEWAIEQASWKV